jgi:hypothetical protein
LPTGIWQWKTDEHGNDVMPDLQSEFLDWLLADTRVPPTQRQWAETHHGPDGKPLNEQTVGRWKRDPRFVKQWELRSTEKNVSIERVQTIMDQLYAKAAGGDMKAIELYMKWVERVSPPKQASRVPDDLESISDADLAALALSLAESGDEEPVVVKRRAGTPIFDTEDYEPSMTVVSGDELHKMLGIS